jgi:hypothetical protein
MLSPSPHQHVHQLTAQQQSNAISSHPQQIQQYTTADPSQMIQHLQASTQSLQSTVVTQQPQTITATTTSTVTPQQIQLQPTNQPGLLYANGVYYAPVTICTCGNQNQYLLST